MRQLVTIKTIEELSPIANADRIEVARVGQWKCVVNKGVFKVGDQCLYFEIDSFLPEKDPRFAFIMKNGCRQLNGASGHRLRTIKLRGQVSQGLALPLTDFPELDLTKDIAEQLGVVLFELPLTSTGDLQAKSLFPSFLIKSDQERLQNIYDNVDKDTPYEITRKMDGTSATYYLKDGVYGVCSRNLELKPEIENLYTRIGKIYNIEEKLRRVGNNIALQGEICGPGIQGNPEELDDIGFYIYNIFNIDAYKYVQPFDRLGIISAINVLSIGERFLEGVPFIKVDKLGSFEEVMSLAEENFTTVKGNIRPQEGVVYKSIDGKTSFKVISNRYLLEEK